MERGGILIRSLLVAGTHFSKSLKYLNPQTILLAECDVSLIGASHKLAAYKTAWK